MHEINTYLLRECEGPTILSVDSVANDSEFSRLISAAHNHSAQTSSVCVFADTTSAFVDRTNEQVSYQNPSHMLNLIRKYCFSVIAGSFIVLHWCLTLFSYSSETWSESVLIVHTTLQFVPVQRRSWCCSDLPTLFRRLKDSSGVVAVTSLWLTTFVCPMIFMIFLPILMFASLQNGFARCYRLTGFLYSYRMILHPMIRWAMAMAFVQIVFALSNLGIAIQFDHSTVLIGTKITQGLSLYVLGIASAILSAAVLYLSDALELSDVCIDPPGMLKVDYAADQPSVMHALEHEPHLFMIRAVASVRFLVLQDKKEPISRHAPLQFWKILLVAQTGILSLLLIVPSLVLTALRFEYKGTASVLIDSPNVALSIYQMPLSFYGNSIDAGTAAWEIRFLGITLIFFSHICPLVALILAVLTWFASPVGSSSSFWNRKRLKLYLNMIHPAVGGIVFSFTLLALRNSITTVDIERSIAKTTPFLKEHVPYISGKCHLEFGYWVFFTQSILLEAFISFTKYWG
jgi:hypothetical protein